MKTENIVIVGGGSSGWMTAATLLSQFPNKKITLIESPNIATVGVGESTLAGINNWCELVGIKDKDFPNFKNQKIISENIASINFNRIRFIWNYCKNTI